MPLLIHIIGKALKLALLAAVVAFACDSTAASGKKGVALPLSTEQPAALLNRLGADWYYDWTTEPFPEVTGAVFVPMIWGVGDRYESNLQDLRRQGEVSALLTFNEPDLKGQSNIAVREVVRRWPDFASIARRISSPGAAAPLGRWMRDFMDAAKQNGLKVDFIAVHWYGPPRPRGFLRFIDKICETYKLPVWITEFAVADRRATNGRPNRYDAAEVVAFLEVALPELEQRPCVERYAWFGGLGAVSERVRPSRLYEPDGTLTPVGEAYSRAGASRQGSLKEQ